jgi:acetoin utilization deacetylase AcuC-like enzyme
MFRRLKAWLHFGGDPPGPRFVIHRGYHLKIRFAQYDARRPFRILAYLRKRGQLRRGMLRRPRAVSLKLLESVHTRKYIRSLADTGAMERIIGLSLDDGEQDRVIQFQRLLCGGTLLAAHVAVERAGVSVNLGGGLHHASRDHGSGFCLFNDVAVAIAHVRGRGHTFPILVIDLDLHDGDGTRAIFADDPTVHTFSIHNEDLGVVAATASTSIALGANVDDATYLAAVREHLPPVFAAVHPGLVFYLAGSDPAVEDRLGDWRITMEGMLERDRFVMNLVRPPRAATALPVVILTAGGYGPLAWRHGAAFFSWLLTGSSRLDIPLEIELPVDHYRRLARLMRHPHLLPDERNPASRRLPGGPAAEDAWGLDEADLGGAGVIPDTRFLGVFSRHGLELALEEYGLLDRLRRMGFEGLKVDIDLEDPLGHTLTIRAGKHRPIVVLELKLRVERQLVRNMVLLSVEWLLIQDARSTFELSRPLLPGQKFPGLGLLRDTVAVLIVASERMDLDGLVFTPTHFHLACLAQPLARFADPVHQARFLALRRATRTLRLPEAARALETGRVRDADSAQPIGWVASPMVIPVTGRLKEYFAAGDYERRTEKAGEDIRFVLEDVENR